MKKTIAALAAAAMLPAGAAPEEITPFAIAYDCGQNVCVVPREQLDRLVRANQAMGAELAKREACQERPPDERKS